MNKKERKEKVTLYGEGYKLLTEALKEIPEEMWQFKPSPNDWSVHEIIIHLADSEAVAAMEVRMFIAQPGGQVMAYDQDAWANILGYHDQDIDEALQFLKLARSTTDNLLKSIPDKAWEHTVLYPGYDQPYKFDEWLSIYANHIPEHIEQIKDNYEMWKERQ
ncbi:MAG: DinB family protein [Chloroflexi bacterium]|nr:DinB family protein [Chloroflexota bacterium]